MNVTRNTFRKRASCIKHDLSRKQDKQIYRNISVKNATLAIRGGGGGGGLTAKFINHKISIPTNEFSFLLNSL